MKIFLDVYRNHLREIYSCINLALRINNPTNRKNEQVRGEIVTCQDNIGRHVFTWKKGDIPYINEEELSKVTPAEAFCLHMATENWWHYSEVDLPNIWDIIYPPNRND